MKALITTIWDDKDPVIRGFDLIKPDFLILIVDKETKDEQKQTIKEIKDYLKTVDRDVRLEIEKFRVYGLHENAKDVANIIKKYSKYDFYVDITASSKPQSMAVAFGAMNVSNTKQIFVTNRDNKVIEIPLLKIEFSENEKIILRTLNKFEGQKINVDKITKETELKQSTIYKYLLEFKKKGYIVESEDKSIELTTTGKFVMI